MDRWKAEMGRVRDGWEAKKREAHRREGQKKEDPGARKGRKIAKHGIFFNDLWPKGSTSRLAKATGAETFAQMRDQKLHAVVVRSTLKTESMKCTLGPVFKVERWKKRTLLRREARLEVKMSMMPHVRTTFGTWDMKKVHAVLAPSKAHHSWPLLEVSRGMWLRREAHFKVKMCNAQHSWIFLGHFGSWNLENVDTHRKAHSTSKMKKNLGVQSFFGRLDVVFCGRCRGLCTLPKIGQTWGFCSNFPMIPEKKFNSRPGAVQNAKFELGKALGLSTTTTVALQSIPFHYATLH